MVYEDAVTWAAECVSSPVISQRPLAGGWTSTMLALDHADGTKSVLRLIDREPWQSHGAGLAIREHETQVLLAMSDVPAPRSLGLDASGEVVGIAAHLMTLLPGEVRDHDEDSRAIEGLARLLISVHAIHPAVWPRTYESWAWEAKYVVPEWAVRPDAWLTAFELVREDPPTYEPTFLHRDFGPHNVLWTDGEISGLVDWVETSTGPAWLDVAHCASNLALRNGVGAAEEFKVAYARLTGQHGDAYWEVMDIGFLAPPGRKPMRDPAQLQCLEDLLAHLLSRIR